MRNRRIVIVTGGGLARNPRTIKEAAALSAEGGEVTVLGAELKPGDLQRDLDLAARYNFRFEPVGSMVKSGSPTLSSWRRFRSRSGLALFKVAGLETRYQLGYFVPELLRRARKLAADYYIVHSEQALWVGARLLRDGRRVGVDMEDWFSEDLLPEARKHRPLGLLRTLEREVLRRATHSSCPSQAMGEALSREYDLPPPAVIYNAFAWGERALLDKAVTDRKDRTIPSIHWCSQTLGRGRGLEDLLAALGQVQYPAEIHLRGDLAEGFGAWLTEHVPESWRRRVFIHPTVPGDKLLSRIAEHDIGFAGEMKYCRNKDLTVSNKILQYLLGGLAVVASDTAGQREVARQAGEAVCIYPSGDADALAKGLNDFLGSPERLARAKAAALRAAQNTFCWEKCAAPLMATVDRALCS